MSKYKKVEDKWAGVDWTKSNKEISEQVGCAYQTVSKKRGELKIPKAKSETEKFFEGLDWTKRDSVLALETGLSHSRLRLWRKKLGHPRGKGRTKCFGQRRFKNADKIDFSKKDAELGRIHGVSRERIRQLRKQAGLPPMREVNLPTWRRIPSGFNWNRATAEIAKELNCSIKTACSVRKKLSAPDSPARPFRRIAWKAVDWSKTHEEISKEIGCSIQTAMYYYRKLHPGKRKCRSTTAKTS